MSLSVLHSELLRGGISFIFYHVSLFILEDIFGTFTRFV